MIISFGKNARDAVPVSRELTFGQFIKLVTDLPLHVGRLHWTQYVLAGKPERSRDKDTRWFMPAVFTRPERRADAVEALNGFVCDFDNGKINRGAIEDFGRRHDCSYVAWTSYSHGLDGLEKWRVFYPYETPVTPDQHARIYDWFNHEYGGNLDPRCATISQLWYLRGRPAGAPAGALFSVDNGRYLDSRVCALSAIPVQPQTTGGLPVGVFDALAARAAADNQDLTGRNPATPLEIRSALNSLDPHLYGPDQYTEWLHLGIAVFEGTKGSNEGYDIFDQWSRTIPGYESEGISRHKWNSFGGRSAGRRITVASLFKQAREAGWSPGDASHHSQPPVSAPAVSVSYQPAAGVQAHYAGQPNAVLPVLSVVVTAPDRWRAHPTNYATQKKIEDPDTGAQQWVTCLRFRVLSLDLLKTIAEGDHTAKLIAETNDGTADATFQTGLVASPAEFKALLLNRGILVTDDEYKELKDLILEWLKKIQASKAVKESFMHFGWMEKDTVPVGFAFANTAYMTDGRIETGIKIGSGGGASIAKHYQPQGNLQTWKSISHFLATQGRPELMAILSTAFGSPLMRFSGHSGAVVSIVSTASGVGKSTALSLAQSVWGSPKAAMHSAADTVLSLSSKMGFTKDLPAYWDDIKGEKTFEQFATTIYHITQGKEKSRLSQTADLREVQNWNCLAVIAANDSIIEIVKRYGRGTDAGAARIFEIRLEQRPTMTQQATFFDACTTNYGHAGAEYAKWLAVNHAKAKTLVEQVSDRLHRSLQVESEERFWVAAIATMIAGAMIAKQIGLVDFDISGLTGFLMTRFKQLRSGKTLQMLELNCGPMISDLILDYQTTTLRIEEMPFKNKTRPVISRPPKDGKVDILLADKTAVLRIRKAKLSEWCKARGHSVTTLLEKLEQSKAITERNVDPMAGTHPYSQGNRTNCYDIDLKVLKLRTGDDDVDP